MEFSAWPVLCEGNSPVTGEFASQWPVTLSIDIFFDFRLKQRLSKQSRRRWFETTSLSLWRHCNVIGNTLYSLAAGTIITCSEQRINNGQRCLEIMFNTFVPLPLLMVAFTKNSIFLWQRHRSAVMISITLLKNKVVFYEENVQKLKKDTIEYSYTWTTYLELHFLHLPHRLSFTPGGVRQHRQWTSTGYVLPWHNKKRRSATAQWHDLLARRCNKQIPWWRHPMEIFSALLAICAGNSPAPGEFPAQRPVTRSFDVFFDLRLNKPLSKQPWGWLFETPSCPLWRQCNVISIIINFFYNQLSSWFKFH